MKIYKQMSPLRIAFGCQARVGKDTACEYLQRTYGGVILHFSDPLYQIMHYAQDVCGFDHTKDIEFLQWIGTNWGRARDSMVWINHTLNRIPRDENCFIGDLRFQNEAESLKEAGFICIRITNKHRSIDRDSSHASEIDLDRYTGWDAIIENNSTIEEFYQQLDKVLKDLKVGPLNYNEQR